MGILTEKKKRRRKSSNSRQCYVINTYNTNINESIIKHNRVKKMTIDAYKTVTRICVKYNQKLLLEAVRAPTSINLLLMYTNKTKQQQQKNPRHILSSLLISENGFKPHSS